MAYADTPSHAIQSGIAGLVFSIFLSHAIKNSAINSSTLPQNIRVDEGGHGIELKKRFTAEELEVNANNIVLTALGISALATDSAMDKTFGPKDPHDTGELGSARAIVYQIRCAFAHDPINPRWDSTPKYNRSYSATVTLKDDKGALLSRTIVFNRPAISGKLLATEDFGGLSGYLALLEYCLGKVNSDPKGSISYCL